MTNTLRFFGLLSLLIVVSGAQAKDIDIPSGGEKIKAYVSTPAGKGPFPALVLIHEWWGLNDWVKGNADDLAKNGYVTLAVDLYRGKVATDPGEAHELMRGLPQDRALRDLTAAVDYLKGQSTVNPKKVGVMGWCMGGGLALQTGLNVPGLAACVVNYGGLVSEDASIRKLGCPMLGIFGEDDRGIPADSARAFESSAKKLGKDVRVIVYPKVGHAFMNPNNKAGFSRETSEKAWKEIHSFLGAKLLN